MSMKPLYRVKPGERICVCENMVMTVTKLRSLDKETGVMELEDGRRFECNDLSGTHVMFGERDIRHMTYISTYWDGLLEFYLYFASMDFKDKYKGGIKGNKAMSNINRLLFPHFVKFYETMMKGYNKSKYYADDGNDADESVDGDDAQDTGDE